MMSIVVPIWEDPGGIPLSGAEKNILLLLAYHYNQDDAAAWPSNSTLSKESGFGLRHVRDLLALLREKGCIEVQRRAGTKTGNDTNRYSFSPAFLESKSAQTRPEKAKPWRPKGGQEVGASRPLPMGLQTPTYGSPDPHVVVSGTIPMGLQTPQNGIEQYSTAVDGSARTGARLLPLSSSSAYGAILAEITTHLGVPSANTKYLVEKWLRIGVAPELILEQVRLQRPVERYLRDRRLRVSLEGLEPGIKRALGIPPYEPLTSESITFHQLREVAE